MATAKLNPPDKTALLSLPPFAGLGLGQIQLPRTSAQTEAAWAELSRHSHIGFDTESRPTFVKGETSSGPDVVQFATHDQAYVLQLRHPACEDLARALLTSEQVVKVGFDLRQDLAQLRQRLGIDAGPLLDLTRVFHRQGYPRTLGIKSAVAIVFGQRFVKSKKLTTTNWANERLEPRQVVYAANDAYVALQVWRALGPGDSAAAPA